MNILATDETFTYSVNMNTLNAKFFTDFEKVIHIAFGCGCVQTFEPEQMTAQSCPTHGDHMISSTEEYREKPTQAA